MSRVHLLSTDETRRTRVVVHAAVPPGNNDVGQSWSSCIVADGRNTTELSVGSGPGQIEQSEADDIASGAVVEIVGWFDVQSAGATNPLRRAALDAWVDRRIAEAESELSRRYRLFGHTQDDL